MQLGGLVASAGINIGLAALFFSLYSIFRRQHFNVNVYFPRYALRETNVFKSDRFHLASLIPSAGWIERALKPNEDEIIAAAGLDAAVLIRIFIFSMKFFAICTLIGVGILAPLHYTDSQVSHESKFDVFFDSLDLFTISNVTDGSNRLWVHLVALYIISLSAYYLLYTEFKHIAEKRVEVLRRARPQPDQFTVLVRSIPRRNDDESYSSHVEEFFTRYHPDTYFTHQMVYKDWKVQRMKSRLDELKRTTDKLKELPPHKRPFSRDGFLGLIGSKVDRLEVKSREYENLFEEHREARKRLENDREAEQPSAFVSFKNRWGAAVSAQTQQTENPLEWLTQWAPEPRDVYWPNLTMPLLLTKLYTVGVGALVFLIIVTYVIPVSLVQTVAQLGNLKKYFPAINVLLKIPGVKDVITGYLPSLLLSLLLSIVPSIMLLLSKLEGYVSRSSQERAAVRKMFWFYVGNVFFITVLSGSLLDQIAVILSTPKDIPMKLASAVPKQATFFITFILTKGWTGFSMEILRLTALALNFFKQRVLRNPTLDEMDVSSMAYHRAVPSVLLFILVGLMYSILAPLLLPFLLLYLVFGFIVYRTQVLFVYEPSYDTSGQLWTHVHGSIIFSLVLMQVTLIGVFGVKKKPTASLLTLPLPFVTLFFDNICRSRFFPVFGNLSMETTMKKDTDDERNSGDKDEVLGSIHNAYRHPALQPSESLNSERDSPGEYLLPGASV